MKYKNIRNNARMLYRQNFKLYILISLAVTAVLAVSYIVRALLPSESVSTIIVFCVVVLTYPLAVGRMVFFYGERLGGHGSFTDVFRFYRDKAQLLNALLLGAIINLPDQISTYSNYLFGFLAEKYPSATFLLRTVPGFLIILAVWIFFLRIYPVPFIFGLKPQMKPFSIIKASFAKTKGYVLDYILFSLSVIWPMIVAGILLAVTVALPAGNAGSGIAAFQTQFLLMLAPLLIFFMPYWDLCVAGFCWEIINNGDELQ